MRAFIEFSSSAKFSGTHETAGVSPSRHTGSTLDATNGIDVEMDTMLTVVHGKQAGCPALKQQISEMCSTARIVQKLHDSA